MSKIFSLFLLSFLFLININWVFAEDKIRIYSREEWWSNEEYRYVNSSFWKNILEKREQDYLLWQKKWANFTQEKKDYLLSKSKIASDKKEKQNNYLSTNFSKDIKLIEYNKFDWTNKLAWPIWKTEFVKNIVIHHTQSEYKNSWEWIKKIQKYHSISREWWDIWYHYIIWYNWEIFEGRAWWDYVVAAHDTWNNRSTVWISIMWNYTKKDLNSQQYNSLKKLVSFLTKRYWIDLNKKIPYHRECYWNDCPNWLETNYYFPIVWHRDWKNTACPWDKNYNITIPKLLKELSPETIWYKKISYLERKKQKQEYIETINKKYNWDKIKEKFNKISENKKKRFLNKLKLETKYKYIDWKKEILYNKIYEELKNNSRR